MHCAQSQQVILRGKVIDDESGKPLSSAFVFTPAGKWITNQSGFFSVRIIPGDSIFVSHVGYETQFFQPIVITDTIYVRLRQETIVLNTVTVRDYQTEEQLKEKVLESPVVETQQVVNARNNLAKIRALYSLGYREQMNNYDRFRYYLKPPQGVNFLGSGGGLIKAIKDISNKPSVRYRPANTSENQPTGMFFVRKSSPDTLKYDSTFVRHVKKDK
jgi:hypothetical protein